MFVQFSTEQRAKQAAARAARAAGRCRCEPAAAAAGAIAAAPQRAWAPSLPAEVWQAVFANVANARDRVALAFSCRDACRNAWRELDLEALDAELNAWRERTRGPEVIDLTGRCATQNKVHPHASLALARLMCVVPEAASKITSLALPTSRQLPLPIVRALLPRCASLRRLLNVRGSPSDSMEVYSAAADSGCPLEHVHLRGSQLTPAAVEVLVRFAPTLRSLYLCYHCQDDRDELWDSYSSVDERPHTVCVNVLLEVLRRVPFTHAELNMHAFPQAILPLASDTLEELVLCGKNVMVENIQCPALRSLHLEGRITLQAGFKEMRAALERRVGCPRLEQFMNKRW